MATGTVKWFSDDKGFGFITPDEGDRDLFVHHTGIHSDGYRSLRGGREVSYEEEQGDKGPKAVNVKSSKPARRGPPSRRPSRRLLRTSFSAHRPRTAAATPPARTRRTAARGTGAVPIRGTPRRRRRDREAARLELAVQAEAGADRDDVAHLVLEHERDADAAAPARAVRPTRWT